jgi:serine/threonine protein kinase
VLRNLEHPNIIKYYDAFMHGNCMCILMEYADNADLLFKVNEYKSLR